MNEFPKTPAALKEAALEGTEGHASDSAYWAVGDALASRAYATTSTGVPEPDAP